MSPKVIFLDNLGNNGPILELIADSDSEWNKLIDVFQGFWKFWPKKKSSFFSAKSKMVPFQLGIGYCIHY